MINLNNKDKQSIQQGQDIIPLNMYNQQTVKQIIQKHYSNIFSNIKGINSTQSQSKQNVQSLAIIKLDSFNDINYKITKNNQQQYLAKITLNTKYAHLQLQNQLMLFLHHSNHKKSGYNLINDLNYIKYPYPLQTDNLQVDSSQSTIINLRQLKIFNFQKQISRQNHYFRLFKFISGTVLYKVQFSLKTCKLFYQYGQALAYTNQKLNQFYSQNQQKVEKQLTNHTIWNMSNFTLIKQYIKQYQQNSQQISEKQFKRLKLIKQFIQMFQKQCLPKISKLSKSLIHNDLHNQNVIIDLNQNKIVGLIDFGDTAYTCRIYDLVIGMTSSMHININQQIIEKDQQFFFLQPAKFVLKGYAKLMKIQNQQFQLLFYLICARNITQYIMCKCQSISFPENDYVKRGLDQIYQNFEKIYLKCYQLIQLEFQKVMQQ